MAARRSAQGPHEKGPHTLRYLVLSRTRWHHPEPQAGEDSRHPGTPAGRVGPGPPGTPQTGPRRPRGPAPLDSLPASTLERRFCLPRPRPPQVPPGRAAPGARPAAGPYLCGRGRPRLAERRPPFLWRRRLDSSACLNRPRSSPSLLTGSSVPPC